MAVVLSEEDSKQLPHNEDWKNDFAAYLGDFVCCLLYGVTVIIWRNATSFAGLLTVRKVLIHLLVLFLQSFVWLTVRERLR